MITCQLRKLKKEVTSLSNDVLIQFIESVQTSHAIPTNVQQVLNKAKSGKDVSSKEKLSLLHWVKTMRENDLKRNIQCCGTNIRG